MASRTAGSLAILPSPVRFDTFIMHSLRALLKASEVSLSWSGVNPVSGTSNPFSRMHWAKTRLGSLLAAFEPALGDLVLGEAGESVVPHALNAAARVRAITARARVCGRVFIETP